MTPVLQGHISDVQDLKIERTACGGKDHGSRRVLHRLGEGGVPWLKRETCLTFALVVARPTLPGRFLVVAAICCPFATFGRPFCNMWQVKP